MYSTLFKTLNRTALTREALNLSSEDAVPQSCLQSATYNVARNSVVLGFNWTGAQSEDPASEALLIEMSPDFGQVKGVHPIAGLYHCNDMTYNPNTNKIYVALLNQPGIGVINASTMIKEANNIQVAVGQEYGDGCFSQISYDAANDRFYLGIGGVLHITDGNFTVIKSVYTQNGSEPEPIGAPHNDGAWTDPQGSDMVDGEFARVWTISEGQEPECRLTASRLEFYDFDTGEVTNFIDFPTRDRYHEAEATLLINGKRYILGYDGTNIYVEEIAKGNYNFAFSPLSADEEVHKGSSNLVTNNAVAERFYHKQNSGDLLAFALSLPAGIHAVQNTTGATPAGFQYMMSIVVKNEAGDLCTIYSRGQDGNFFMNHYSQISDGVFGWYGWRYCKMTAAPNLDQTFL